MNVLLADDSEFMRMLLKDIVHSAWPDAVLSEATSGLEAIEQFNASPPDLVLMDIMMPGKTGLEVLKEIGPNTPVLIISAAGQDNMIEEAKQLGAKDFIVKPFEKTKVIETIKTALGTTSIEPTNSDIHG